MNSSPSSQRPSWIGQILSGRYRIDEMLGQGGMSAVYKAYDPNLKRFVAVKLIHSHLAGDPEFLTRFEEEAAAVAQLRHANIVQVYDFNHDEDLYYMVQEFLVGETLQEQLQRLNQSDRRMPLQDAIQHALDICDAIDYAHKRGMIHRDIKPANIMLGVQGQAILMDFGIVKITGGERHTATGAVVGTALYMSPEIIRGETPDARADVYSLGVTLFEMVNGHPPFEADSVMSLMMMHLKDPVPDLSQLRPEVPEDLIDVIERALAKDLNNRFGSAMEMSAALKRVLDRLQAGAALETKLSESKQDPDQVATLLETAPPAPEKTSTVVEGMSPGQNRDPEGQPAKASVQVETPTLREGGIQSDEAVADGPIRASAPAPERGKGAGDFSTPPAPPKRALLMALPGKPIYWIVGVVAVLLVLGGLLISKLIGGNDGDLPVAAAQQTQTAQVFSASIGMNGADAFQTPAPTITIHPTATETLVPTSTATPTISPTATIPVGVPFSRINGISIGNQGNYIVNYETFEFTEILPGMHVHFFFNTVPQEEAGVPGDGPWYLWGGPRPFDRYLLSDRPEAATQMCILVANADHSVQLNSGNCVILPDVSVVTANLDLTCRSGPDMAYPEAVDVSSGQVMPVIGISPDENWWQVSLPDRESETCWIERDQTTFAGDITTLPLSEPPPLPTAKTVTITGIHIDAQNQYVVDYITQGFTEQLPGTHLHFFFNTVPAEDVGAGGSSERIMHGGPTPFTRYTTSDRPEGATQICVLVANPDHSVIQDSGNCFNLPDAP